MNIIHRIGWITAAALAAALLSACGREETVASVPPGTIEIQGAGATFPAPLYEKWIEIYQQDHPGVQFSYEAVGSGEGIKRFLAGSVDFAASDAPMKDSEIAQVDQGVPPDPASGKRGVRPVPITAGMIVLAYNLPGIEGPLKLTREAYVDLLLGEIDTWDDPRIQAANPDLDLPTMNIAIVARRDSSGTTFALTNHLSTISDAWRARGPGTGKLIDWPRNAMTARGNEGVAQRVKMSQGSIGYVEYGFAKRLGLPMAWLQNTQGEFVAADAHSGQLALASGGGADPRQLFVTDPDSAGAYPIVTYSWLFLYDHYPDMTVARVLKEAVGWGLTDGQTVATEMGYIPLPEEVALRGLEVVNRVH